MSEFDEMDFDDEELDDLRQADPDSLTPEDVFSMVMINRKKMTKQRAELEDSDGDIVELADIMEQIVGYIKDRLSETENQFADQIMPLMSQASISVLGRMMGIDATALLMSNPMSRDAIIYAMCSSFLLLKWVQEKNIIINTIEQEISSDEVEAIERKAAANSVATMGSFLGVDPRDILKQMYSEGKISKDDFDDLLNGEDDDDDDTDN